MTKRVWTVALQMRGATMLQQLSERRAMRTTAGHQVVSIPPLAVVSATSLDAERK